MVGKNVVNDPNTKLIFGLKLRQLRQDKSLLLSELSKRSGISVSYLTEIEQGKKFPKADKIASLAEALGVTYDWLISLQLSKNLGPVSQLLQSRILQESPLDVFGIDKAQLLELLSATPVKLNAFLATLMEVSRKYNLKIEDFYQAALRSYQEMNENYFPDIENAVDELMINHDFNPSKPLQAQALFNLLRTAYQYELHEKDFSSQEFISNIFAVLLAGQPATLLLNQNLSEQQKAFVVAREIGFQMLDINIRPSTSPAVQIDSYEQVLNNFKGTYFASALILNKDLLVPRLQLIFNNRSFDTSQMLALIEEFGCTPEAFLHRLTNLLPRFFGIPELFLVHFKQKNGAEDIELTHELHLSGLHDPHASIQNEHYCGRSASVNILQDLATSVRYGTYIKPLLKIQRSRFTGSEKEYLVISFATPAMNGSDTYHSISLGMLLTDQMKIKIRFWNDPTIPVSVVGNTCERCPIADCSERKARASVYEKAQQTENMKLALRSLSV